VLKIREKLHQFGKIWEENRRNYDIYILCLEWMFSPFMENVLLPFLLNVVLKRFEKQYLEMLTQHFLLITMNSHRIPSDRR
jgi:hypothetical protein